MRPLTRRGLSAIAKDMSVLWVKCVPSKIILGSKIAPSFMVFGSY
jgi:hypothetical protein